MKQIVIAYSASKARSYQCSLALQWFPILMLFLATVLFSSGVFANDARYKKSWDSICGIGESISAGCDIIREREIMDSKVMPWRAIGQVNYSGYQHSQHCTGTLIGPKHFITAAHCVYDQKRRRWIAPGAINFLAGYGKGEYVAASKGVSYILSDSHLIGASEFEPKPAEDWVIVELKDEIGSIAGYLDLHKAGEPVYGSRFIIAGYPGIRKYVLSSDDRCGKLRLLTKNGVYYHDCATMKGDSGGPLLVQADDKFIVLGVASGLGVIKKKTTSLVVPSGNISARKLSFCCKANN